MDYYDILGIRPSASATEIELAYKGRRSQYHPDRYASSDADTISWATSKIKEVNEAYSVLIDPDSRANFDRRNVRQTAPPAQAQTRPAHSRERPADPEPLAAKDAASILLRPNWDWQLYEKIHARPNIPQKKLAGAISSYAFDVAPSDVIVLLDDTLFGGAKEGLLVTNNAIYCKQKFEDPVHMAFTEIKRVFVGTESNLIINNQEFFKAIVIDQVAMANFASRLSRVFEQPSTHSDGAKARSHESTASPSGEDLLWRVHLGAMTILHAKYEGEEMGMVDELIERHMRIVANELPFLIAAVEKLPIPSRTSANTDAESVQFALILFVILHYHALSKLPFAFKDEMGDSMAHIYGVSEIYKNAFHEEFSLVFDQQPVFSEELLTTISAMFLYRDEMGILKLKNSREEELATLLARLHIQGNLTDRLISAFVMEVKWWYNRICTMADGEDED